MNDLSKIYKNVHDKIYDAADEIITFSELRKYVEFTIKQHNYPIDYVPSLPKRIGPKNVLWASQKTLLLHTLSSAFILAHNEIPQLLLDLGADVNCQDIERWNGLMLLAQNTRYMTYKHIPLIEHVIAQTNDLDARDASSNRALDWLITSYVGTSNTKEKEIDKIFIKKLIDAGANSDYDKYYNLNKHQEDRQKEIKQYITILLEQKKYISKAVYSEYEYNI